MRIRAPHPVRQQMPLSKARQLMQWSRSSAEHEQIDSCVTPAAVSEGQSTDAFMNPVKTYWKGKHARTCARKLHFTISCIVFSSTSPHGGIRLSQHAQTETTVDANRVALKESLCNFMVCRRTRVSQALFWRVRADFWRRLRRFLSTHGPRHGCVCVCAAFHGGLL